MPIDSKFEGVVYDGDYDVVVIGGGVAGVCAAIAAARHGCSTALVHDRPVLGGNSSSEVRVNMGGADAHNSRRHARESGIVEELRLEDRMHNHEPVANGFINWVWDVVLLDAVRREPALTLFLNASAQRAIMADETTIEGVVAYQTSTFRTLHLRGHIVIDASGDGTIAADAGAHYRMGREPRSEYGEPTAPEDGDQLTLGSSLLFKAVDAGHPVPFIPPDWAYPFESEDDLPFRDHSYFPRAGFWWIEHGGTMDTIADNEHIRDDLLAYLLGIWDHIKNRGDHGAENYVLEWVGAVPGKRESRRFLGDYVLRESDLRKPTAFADAVAYGGWSIDLHPPEGIHANEPPCSHVHLNAVYGIPFRSLYSRNIRNLLFAGRNISASHVAFGSTRLIATGGVMGQAVGVAAALCKRCDATPRQIQRDHIAELQQALLRDDCYVPGVASTDRDDLARTAHASATSAATLAAESPDHAVPLDTHRAQLIPVTADRVDTVHVLLDSSRGDEAGLTADLHWAQALDDFTLGEPVAHAEAHVPSAGRHWVELDFHAVVKPRGLYVLILHPCDGVAWLTANDEPPGTQRAARVGEAWRHLGQRGTHCFRIWPESAPFGPDTAINGFARPDGWPNLWISDPAEPLPQSLTLDFGSPHAVATVMLTFDTNLNRLVGYGPAAPCVRAYALSAETDGGWRELLRIEGNYQRRRTHLFGPVETSRLRLDVLATWGVPTARLYEIRAYAP